MKLTFILLFAFCLHLSASSVAQNVTFSGKDVPLQRIFTEIEKQTGNVIFISKQLLKDAKPVTVQAENMPLQAFLSTVLKGQPLDYTMEKQTVFIRRKAVVTLPVLKPALLPVRGTITDSLGVPLAGASIRVKRTKVSTVSDNAGAFTIEAEPGDILVISFVGFKTKEHRVNSGQALVIPLFRESTTMAEIAVTLNTGYQSIPRERATGSFSIVSGKQLENKLRPDLKAALEGQIAGMVLANDGSLEVRGVSTFMSEERAPLIIVDGFPLSGGLETLNIDNIESVTVLKDAVAASIYGARSSNGVIVVTTKQGRKGALNVAYNGSVGLVMKPDLSYLRRTNAADYVEAEMELYEQNPTSALNFYNNYSYLSRLRYLLVAKSLNIIPAAEADSEIEQLKQNDGLGQLQRYLFRNQVTHQHNISLSGGTDKNQVAASAKFITNRGSSLYTGDERLILDLRNDWKPSRRISVRLFSNVNYSTSEAPIRPLTDFLSYHSQYTLHPYDLVVDPETGAYQNIHAVNPKKVDRYAALPGMKSMHYNPLEDLGKEMNRTQNLQFRIGGNVNVLLARGLSLDAGGSWTRGNTFTRGVYSGDSYRMRVGYNDGTSISNPAKHYIPDGDMVTESRNVNQAYTLRAQLNFNRSFGDHSVIAIAGSELTRDVRDYNSFPTRFGYNDQAGTFATFNYADYNAGLYNADMIGTTKPQSPVGIGGMSFRDNRFVSWYANASYEYDRRFLVSGSVRLDLTNFFGTDPRFRYKPLWSAGGTYKLSNEDFFDVSWMNKLYLRGSYGINGNISLNYGPFLIIAPGSFSNLTGDISYNISSPPNNTLRWEKTGSTNFGVDMSFFSRLNLTLDYYLRKSEELLSSNEVDPTRGYTSLIQNVGRINNTGIELALDGDVLRKQHLTWNVLGTVSYNKNKVVDYNASYLYATSLTTSSVNREGYPGSAVFSYRAGGIDNNGNALYLNAAGEKISGGALSVEDVVYSGTYRPKFAYSLTNTFRYKNFDLSFMLLAKTGHVMRKNVFEGLSIQHADVAKRWRKPGDEKSVIYPKLSGFSMDAFYFPYSDIFTESANFLKLRDASLTYNFNRGLLRKAGISTASLTFQGRNLLLLAANSDKRDPEAFEMGATDMLSNEMGFTQLRPMPEFYLGLRVNF
ncbi:SusC/RagA family TonB-linked outer membrane protein [Chitinophaga cymbidii]|uniref:SusC/RagA family TonB-linked outer membrane protein n=1 Tax=Chitinophaga cymbidii TaxID=1096750 RepID=A0A512RK68_9BACT|nr:SusC/RagA family TonB-linked outer membrane protein [Chitinophaga cymbidii]GEP96113.1 SusC/RagA family TonB-linked outer membrane protein [Chitinophaga cymbidii]